MKCGKCSHEKHYHFIVDEHGHEEEARCAFFYGSGKFRCGCDGYDEAHAHEWHKGKFVGVEDDQYCFCGAWWSDSEAANA